jgi:hypothetical protein
VRVLLRAVALAQLLWRVITLLLGAVVVVTLLLVLVWAQLLSVAMVALALLLALHWALLVVMAMRLRVTISM